MTTVAFSSCCLGASPSPDARRLFGFPFRCPKRAAAAAAPSLSLPALNTNNCFPKSWFQLRSSAFPPLSHCCPASLSLWRASSSGFCAPPFPPVFFPPPAALLSLTHTDQLMRATCAFYALVTAKETRQTVGGRENGWVGTGLNYLILCPLKLISTSEAFFCEEPSWVETVWITI